MVKISRKVDNYTEFCINLGDWELHKGGCVDKNIKTVCNRIDYSSDYSFNGYFNRFSSTGYDACKR